MVGHKWDGWCSQHWRRVVHEKKNHVTSMLKGGLTFLLLYASLARSLISATGLTARGFHTSGPARGLEIWRVLKKPWAHRGKTHSILGGKGAISLALPIVAWMDKIV